ncbi:hypothetical protein GF327_03635 [Candidatus Woesearchaeota archaeon]|nr:hypothetical protein [Candidatus Woesearchaeota archaeon]
MGFLKNICLDLSFLDIRRLLKKNKESEEKTENQQIKEQVSQSDEPRQPPRLPRSLFDRKSNQVAPPEKAPSTLPEISYDFFKKQGKKKNKQSLKSKPIQKQITEEKPFEKIPVSENTFFNNLVSDLKKDSLEYRDTKNVIVDDLFSSMKEFWQNKKYDRGNKQKLNFIKKEVVDRMQELHELEVEWQKSKITHETLGDNLHKKELEIESKIRELKKIFQKHHAHMEVKQELFFNVKNGMTIKSLSELNDKLPEIPDEVFFFHVNENKNDFSTWINDVFGLKNLAKDLSGAKSRNEFSEILEKHVSDEDFSI